MSLMANLKSTGTIKGESAAESDFFKPKELVQTNVPIINVALTGTLDGGLPPGVMSIAGPSRHFKSNLGLVIVSSFLRKFKDDPDAMCLFYDSEFGTTPEYLTAHGIDTRRVLHLPITNIEMLREDISQKLEKINEGDNVIIFVDSAGNLASLKEVNDALDSKTTQDMTRAKVFKSLFRIITPILNKKKLSCILIQHTYETMETYSKQVMSGGQAALLASNIVWIVGRSQEKNKDKELVGYNFTINIEKSRFVKEKSKLVFQVKFDGGIDKFSGLLDIALQSGHVQKPSIGWYSRVDTETGEVEKEKFREADTHNMEFWKPILSDKTFYDFVRTEFQLAVNPIEVVEDETE